MLIKKTIVLSDDGVVKGHLTLIRVGSDVGGKLSTFSNVDGGQLYVKIKDKETCVDVNGVKTEFSLNIPLEADSIIGVVLVVDGVVVCKGGRHELVQIKDETKELEQETLEEARVEKMNDLNESVKINIPNSQEEEPESINLSETPNVDVEEETIVETVPQTEENVEEYNEVKTPESPFKVMKGANFYKNVRGKLEEIMTANPRESTLEKLIPDSKWVKVYYEKDEYYAVGVLSEEGEVTFLAYGVPGLKRVKPPKDAEELCDFLEVDAKTGQGYWLMFQNAKTGEIADSL